MHQISEGTTITLSLVIALLGMTSSFAFFLNRFVTKSELKDIVDFWREEIKTLDTKLDALLLKQLDK